MILSDAVCVCAVGSCRSDAPVMPLTPAGVVTPFALSFHPRPLLTMVFIARMHIKNVCLREKSKHFVIKHTFICEGRRVFGSITLADEVAYHPCHTHTQGQHSALHDRKQNEDRDILFRI